MMYLSTQTNTRLAYPKQRQESKSSYQIEPMHKLTNVEAQRVLSVLQEGIGALNFLSYVPASHEYQIVEHLSNSGFNNLTGAMEKQWQIEDSVMALAAAAMSSPLRHGSKTGATMTHGAGHELQQQLHQATRNLTREMNKAPDAVRILQGVFQEERGVEFILFLQKLSELKAIMYRKLSTTVEEDMRTSTLLRELTEKRKTAQNELETLTKNLINEQKEKERETSALEKTLNKLQHELAGLTKSSNQEIESISNEMSSSIEKSTTEHEARKSEVAAKVNSLLPLMAKTSEEHKQTEALWRKKRTKTEVELAGFIAEYDQAMQMKQEEIDRVKEAAEVEGKELAELQEHFDRLAGNEAQIRLEGEILASVRRREEEAMRLMYRGAAKLQAIYRGRKARAEVAKMKVKTKPKKAAAAAGGKEGKKKKRKK